MIEPVKCNQNTIPPVAHVLMSSGRGGIELLLARMSAHTENYPGLVYIIRGETGDDSPFPDRGIAVEYGSRGLTGSLVRLFIFARRHRRHIIHGYNLGPLNLLMIWLAGAEKVVYSIRGTVYWKNQRQRMFLGLLWKIALLKKPVFIANSDYSAEVFKTSIDKRSNIRTIYNPIAMDDEKFKERTPLKAIAGERGSLSVIYAGRLVKGKNLFLWLEIAQHILAHFPDAGFRIYGEGNLRKELISYAGQLRIDDRVEFMGFTKDMAAAMKEADLLLFLSERESFGNVVVESILAGTPVLCSDIPSMREIFRSYPEFIVKPDNDIRQNIILRIKDLETLTKLAAKASDEFRHRFSPRRYYEEVQSVYASFRP